MPSNRPPCFSTDQHELKESDRKLPEEHPCKISLKFLDLVDLVFKGTVNTIKVMSSWSVYMYLTTFFLGRRSPLNG